MSTRWCGLRNHLTDRDRKLLGWLYDHHTLTAAGQRLLLSTHTPRSHHWMTAGAIAWS
jgi:hypothetical protein